MLLIEHLFEQYTNHIITHYYQLGEVNKQLPLPKVPAGHNVHDDEKSRSLYEPSVHWEQVNAPGIDENVPYDTKTTELRC
jgi:hypothetical protein